MKCAREKKHDERGMEKGKMGTTTEMNELEALRALGIPDDEIRARAEWLDVTAEECDNFAEGAAHQTFHRLNAAILRAAEQLGAKRIPVTRETPLGTEVAHNSGPKGDRFLVGWDDGPLIKRVLSNGCVGYYRGTEDGWYVVEGADDE